MDAARTRLLDVMCNYQGQRNCQVIVVFDAYKVAGNPGHSSQYHNIHVVYTKESQTADAYIEQTTYALAREYRVRVVSSDNAEQLIILGHGALRVSARAFREELDGALAQLSTQVERNNQRFGKVRNVSAAFEKAKKESH